MTYLPVNRIALRVNAKRSSILNDLIVSRRALVPITFAQPIVETRFPSVSKVTDNFSRDDEKEEEDTECCLPAA